MNNIKKTFLAILFALSSTIYCGDNIVTISNQTPNTISLTVLDLNQTTKIFPNREITFIRKFFGDRFNLLIDGNLVVPSEFIEAMEHGSSISILEGVEIRLN